MKITLKKLSLAIAGAGMLTIYGCGGGGGGAPLVPTSTSPLFTPSLGQFSVGTLLTVTKLDGTLLSTGTIGANGSVTLSLSNDVYPVVVKVAGAADVKYFDERLKDWTPFEPGMTLSAVVPTPMAQVGVTALTNAAAVKLASATGGIAGASVATINDANAKIAAMFGLPDILVAPTPVNNTTIASLDLAAPADKYALVLAALAESASGSDTAATLSTKLALDLKDDVLDSKDGLTTITGYTLSPTTLATAYQTMAATLATPTSASVVASQPLVVTSDVKAVVAVTNQSDVTLAKAMFAELRATLNSFANGSTGFLDTQATRMNTDLSANVVPELSNVANRLGALNETMSAFEDAKANANGFTTGTIPNTSTPALVRTTGSLQSVWAGTGSFDSCWTDSVTPSAFTKITCYHAGPNNADYANSRIKMVAYELTETTANQYSYTATRRNKAVTIGLSGPVFTSGTTLATVPAGNGTVTKTVSGTATTGLTLNGTMPPSASTAAGALATGVDTIAISAVRTALTAANTYRYALSGSVSTSKLDANNVVDLAKVVTLSLDSGSYLDLNETTAATTGSQIIGAKFLGTAQTPATKFTGSIDVDLFVSNKNSVVSPTRIVFNGSIHDLSTGGAGQILTGKLEAAVADYANFDSSLAESSSNYLHASVTFTGTVQAPSRPQLKLVLAASKTGVTTSTVTLNYSYGTNVSITGSGSVNSANTAANTMTLSNQAGIELVIAKGVPAKVKKSSVELATITNGMISYIDGVSESLN